MGCSGGGREKERHKRLQRKKSAIEEKIRRRKNRKRKKERKITSIFNIGVLSTSLRDRLAEIDVGATRDNRPGAHKQRQLFQRVGALQRHAARRRRRDQSPRHGIEPQTCRQPHALGRQPAGRCRCHHRRRNHVGAAVVVLRQAAVGRQRTVGFVARGVFVVHRVDDAQAGVERAPHRGVEIRHQALAFQQRVAIRNDVAFYIVEMDQQQNERIDIEENEDMNDDRGKNH